MKHISSIISSSLTDVFIMHLEKILLHLMSIMTVFQKHTILQIAEDMHLASDYDTSFMGKDTVPLQYIKMPPMSTCSRTMIMKDSSDLEDLYEEVANFSVQEVTRLMILPLPLLQHVHVLGPLALF